jgi:hypothetical protein
MDAGGMIARFLDEQFGEATSISFVSHSLGARVTLQSIAQMKRPARRAILMAGAIADNCLTGEYTAVPAKVDSISVLASKEDWVLEWAFPIGNLAAEIIDRQHPWWEGALGRFGPSERPAHYQSPCQIPNEWDYGHGDYLRTDPPASAPILPPTDVPNRGQKPQNGDPGWQEAWSASFASTRFK